MKSINKCHSNIEIYPINYNKFPLAKNCKIYKVTLNKNDFITIPKYWHHWVFTEPNTLAVSYDIYSIYSTDTNNVFYDSYYNSKPYKLKGNNNLNINYDDFYNHSLDQEFTALFSNTFDCSPVYKNNKIFKTFKKDKLKNLIDIKDKNNFYSYIGHEEINKNSYLYDFSDIKNLINFDNSFSINYKSFLWYTLDKLVDSGLHYDEWYGLLYVLDGKKTIFLIEPASTNNLYISDFEMVKCI